MEGDTNMTENANNRVLLVEDYEGNIVVGQTYLELFGFDVDVARNGRLAVECAERTRYAAILMDVEMPEMDGLAATTRIRQTEAARKTARTPIIVLTSHLTTAIRRLCTRAGADLVLAKPMTAQIEGDLARLMAAA